MSKIKGFINSFEFTPAPLITIVYEKKIFYAVYPDGSRFQIINDVLEFGNNFITCSKDINLYDQEIVFQLNDIFILKCRKNIFSTILESIIDNDFFIDISFSSEDKENINILYNNLHLERSSKETTLSMELSDSILILNDNIVLSVLDLKQLSSVYPVVNPLFLSPIASLKEDISLISDKILDIYSKIELLEKNKLKENETIKKAQDLDVLLENIEDRIGKMQKAREWLAKTETRMEEVSYQAKEQVKILGSILKKENEVDTESKRIPSMGARDVVTRLAHQGWSTQEIARTTKLSRGEVELFLELLPKK